MTFGPSRISAAVKNRFQTTVGKRFSRFLLVATGAVVASQLTLTICLGPVGLTAGKSAIAAWLAGAVVSYVLSRWAWERKGRPSLLKETLPFGVIAIGSAVVLTLTAKWANEQALDMGLSHVQQVLFVDAAYFLANCVTFITRFLIFHYVLFKDRGSKVSELVAELSASEFPGARPAAVSAADDGTASEPLAATGSTGRVNGSPVWDEAALPEPGTRR
jgi:putative flippase GtrA